MANQKKNDLNLAPVDKKAYPERPLKEAQADPKDIAEIEDRPEKDQIEDYHKKHPTLKASKVPTMDQIEDVQEPLPGA